MRRIFIVPAILAALTLGGCATLAGLQNPFQDGKFSNEIWRANLVIVKEAARQGGQAVLDTMDALCPEIHEASAVINDPTNTAAAQAVLGLTGSALQKNLNNINDTLNTFSDVCRIRDAKGAQAILVASATAINNARAILAAAKR